MFGYSHELCGELGLSWCQRLMLLDETLSANGASARGLPIPTREVALHLGSKYGYDSANAAAAPARIAQIMRLFASRLAQRRAGGHRFLVGDQLSALDIYWATFISRIQPLQQDLCPMPEQLRASFYCGSGRESAHQGSHGSHAAHASGLCRSQLPGTPSGSVPSRASSPKRSEFAFN